MGQRVVARSHLLTIQNLRVSTVNGLVSLGGAATDSPTNFLSLPCFPGKEPSQDDFFDDGFPLLFSLLPPPAMAERSEKKGKRVPFTFFIHKQTLTKASAGARKQATALAAAAVHRARLSNFLLAASPSPIPIFPSQENHEGREG